jgi:glycosyltransferase involved in cell wall biosynthesis
MRLLLIVDTYVPARISGALQMHDLAREMLAQGHEPTVVVPAPGLPVPWRVERVDGVEVLRVRTLQTKDVAKPRRALAEWRLPYALLRGLRRSPLAHARWEGLVWYSPTIFLGPMVRALKRRDGCRAYLILRDLFPDWAVDTGVMRKGLAYAFLKRVERAQYAAADVIGVQTRANEALVAADCPREVRVETLHNWLAKPAVRPSSIDLSAGPLAGRTIFAYTGNMGAAQGMDCLIDLARRMKDRREAGFLFVGRGSGVPRLQALVDALALDNVMFVDEVDSAEIPAILAQCHVGLIALDPRHTTHNIPGKLLTYLHAGLPVLARINAGNDLEGLIAREGIGRVVVGDRQEELQSFARDLLADARLRAEIGGRGRVVVERIFSPGEAARRVMRALAGAPSRIDVEREGATRSVMESRASVAEPRDGRNGRGNSTCAQARTPSANPAAFRGGGRTRAGASGYLSRASES